MTQKELSYVEDAIGHEKSIISILNDGIQKLENEELIVFLENQVTEHTNRQEKLTSMLEVKADEW